MALPIAPLAWTALRMGAVAAATYYVSRRAQPAPKHVWRERAMDDARDGVEFTTQRGEHESNAHSAVRFRRVVRMPNGQGVEVDLTALGRVRFRRVD